MPARMTGHPPGVRAADDNSMEGAAPDGITSTEPHLRDSVQPDSSLVPLDMGYRRQKGRDQAIPGADACLSAWRWNVRTQTCTACLRLQPSTIGYRLALRHTHGLFITTRVHNGRTYVHPIAFTCRQHIFIQAAGQDSNYRCCPWFRHFRVTGMLARFQHLCFIFRLLRN